MFYSKAHDIIRLKLWERFYEIQDRIFFKKAIIIDAQFLREMQKQILNYCDKIDYEANLENGDNIKFESLEELILFENSKINKYKRVKKENGEILHSLNIFVTL